MIPDPENPNEDYIAAEEEKAMRVHGIAVIMRQYQRRGIVNYLALLLFGSTKVFDSYAQSLGVSYVQAYLANRDVTTALRMQHADHTRTHTAAILMSMLHPECIKGVCDLLGGDNSRDPYETQFNGINLTTIEAALTLGIAELLTDNDLVRLGDMADLIRKAVDIAAS